MALVRYAILCANTKEQATIKNELGKEFPETYSLQDGSTVHIALSRVNDLPICISVDCCPIPGNIGAATISSHVVVSRSPVYVFFVGIAGSLAPEKLKQGDVFFPERVLYRIYDKVVDDETEVFKKLQSDDKFDEYLMKNNSNALLKNTDEFTVSKRAQSLISDFFAKELGADLPVRQEPNLAILNCEMVINSKSFVKLVQSESMRKLFAVDMESYGFFKTISELNEGMTKEPTQAVMVRGVSDYAVDKELANTDNDWEEEAVRNATRATCRIIKDNLTSETK